MPSACMSTKHQKAMPCSRHSLAAACEDLQRLDEVGLGAAVDAVAMFEDHHVTFGRAPAEIGEAVEEGVPVVAEPLGEGHGAADGFEQLQLVAGFGRG